MRRLLLVLIAVAGFNAMTFAQGDTIFFAGNARNYGDSVVLRWNGINTLSFLRMFDHEIMVERKNAEDNFEVLATLKADDVENRTQNTGLNERSLLALASVYELKKNLGKSAVMPDEIQALRSQMDFLWANASLMADLSPEAAKLLNLRYCDKNPPKGQEEVIYRIYVKNAPAISDTLYFVVVSAIHQPLLPGELSAFELEGQVRLEWNADKQFSAYYVERSGKSADRFELLNKNPLVVPGGKSANPVMLWTDSVKNYTPHQYRIYAIDMFGDRSLYAEPVTAQGRDRTPPTMPVGLRVTENKNKTLTLTWDKVMKMKDEWGLALGMSHVNGDVFTPLHKEILPLSTSTFTVPFVEGQTEYFFILQMFDTAGNSSEARAYYQLNDFTAPSKPKGLKAVIDTNGVVTLTWNWNKEPDLDGYLVYFSNSLKQEFSGVVNVPLMDTVFRDTLPLNMLNRDVFYCVEAVDRRLNRSEISEKVRVMRPDTLRPVSPLIKQFEVFDTAIVLHWDASPSLDVANHRLKRTEVVSGKIKVMNVSPSGVFFDKDLSPGIGYRYSFGAIDSSGNQSEWSNEVELTAFREFYRPAVKYLLVQYDTNTKEVNLKWQHPYKEVSRVLIYRGSAPDQLLLTPIRCAPDAREAIDPKAQQGKVFYYAIKLYLKDNTQTYMSLPVSVETFTRP